MQIIPRWRPAILSHSIAQISQPSYKKAPASHGLVVRGVARKTTRTTEKKEKQKQRDKLTVVAVGTEVTLADGLTAVEVLLVGPGVGAVGARGDAVGLPVQVLAVAVAVLSVNQRADADQLLGVAGGLGGERLVVLERGQAEGGTRRVVGGQTGLEIRAKPAAARVVGLLLLLLLRLRLRLRLGRRGMLLQDLDRRGWYRGRGRLLLDGEYLDLDGRLRSRSRGRGRRWGGSNDDGLNDRGRRGRGRRRRRGRHRGDGGLRGGSGTRALDEAALGVPADAVAVGGHGEGLRGQQGHGEDGLCAELHLGKNRLSYGRRAFDCVSGTVVLKGRVVGLFVFLAVRRTEKNNESQKKRRLG